MVYGTLHQKGLWFQFAVGLVGYLINAELVVRKGRKFGQDLVFTQATKGSPVVGASFRSCETRSGLATEAEIRSPRTCVHVAVPQDDVKKKLSLWISGATESVLSSPAC